MGTLARPALALAAALPLALAALIPAQSASSTRALERTVRYEYRIFHPGDGPSGAVTCWVPLPWTGERQALRYLVASEPGLVRRFTDDHGQELLEYRFESIPARGFVEVGFTVGIELKDRSWPLPGDGAQPPVESLAEPIRARCLAAESNYSMDSRLMQDTASELVAGAGTDFEKLARIYEHITGEVRYQRDGRWDPAVEVLQRGTGSCSEYNYLLSGLCRLAGLPTRCVGGSTSRNAALPCTDTVFHRWTEVWLDDYGWFPLDCSRGANPRRGKERHFGRVEADLLVWCRQPSGGDDYLGWEYRAQLRRDGEGPRLRTNHRARWFGYVPEQQLRAAIRWLERGGDRVPRGDALEAALVAWDRCDDARRERVVQLLAEDDRPAALRRALTLPEERRDRCVTALCDAPLHQEVADHTESAWAFRSWFRDHEAELRRADGVFTLERDGRETGR